MSDKLRDAAQQALEALINARDTTDSDTLFVEFDVNITGLRAALAQQDAQAVPQGWKLVPSIGTRVKANHPITCLNPDEWFEVSDVRSEPDGGFVVRGKSTCWFGISMLAAPTPLAQRVELTDEEIEDLARGKSGHNDFAQAVIEAYERKNGIK